MSLPLVAALSLLALQAGVVRSAPALAVRAASTYTVTLKNNCAFKVWPAASQWNRGNAAAADFPLVDSSQPGLGADGLAQGASVVIKAPMKWLGARVWARTDCTGSGSTLKCRTGDCLGKAVCGPDYNDYLNYPTEFNKGIWFELGFGKGSITAGNGSPASDGIAVNLSRIQGFNVGMTFTGNGFNTQFGPGGHSCPTAQCTAEEAYVTETKDDSGPVLLANANQEGLNFDLTFCP